MSKVESLMKKLFGMVLLVLLASHIMAQDVISPTVGSHVLSREGNKFYCDGEKISRRDVQAYIKFNADQDIYKQFRSGRQMYNTGWGLLGTGLALDAFAIGFTLGLCASYHPDPDRPTMGPGLALLLISTPIAAGGLAFTITGIPLVCVGQNKMKKSFDAYNISLPQTSFQPELRLQANNNGIGLVCSF